MEESIKLLQRDCAILQRDIQNQIEILAANFSNDYKRKINENVRLWFNIIFVEDNLEASLAKKREFYAKISTLLECKKVIYTSYSNADQFVDLINKEYDLLLLGKI